MRLSKARKNKLNFNFCMIHSVSECRVPRAYKFIVYMEAADLCYFKAIK